MTDDSNIIVGGAPEGYDAQLVIKESLNTNRPVLHVARDDKRLAAMAEAIHFFAPEIPVFQFPSWDCLPYDRISPQADISAARMAILAMLLHKAPERFLLLTTLNAATQKIPPRAILRNSVFRATVGNRINEAELRTFFRRMGFNQCPTVMERGDFALRGGIIDIFPPGDLGPVRLDLFGDLLDGARRFDPATQLTTEKLKEIELAPVSEVILDDKGIRRFRQNYRIEFGALRADDPLYEAVSAGLKYQGLEHWLAFFYDHLETIFDYLPSASITLDDQITSVRLARWDSIQDQYETRHLALNSKSKIDSVYKPIPPEKLYLDDVAWTRAISKHRVLQFHPLAQPIGLNVIDASGRIGRNFSPERQLEKVSWNSN